MWNSRVLTMMFVQMVFGFSFYGVMTILTPFFLNDLKYNESDTMMIIGSFSALGTLFAVAGGFLGDKLLGEYRILLLSFVSFALGFGALGFGAASLSPAWCLFGIALIIYGRGLKATNYSTLFRKVFDSHEDFERAYTVNYSINNVGSLLATYGFPFIAGAIAYKGGFGVASVLCVIAVIAWVVFRKEILPRTNALDKSPMGGKNWGIFAGISVAMVALVYFMFANVGISKYIVYVISFVSVAYFLYLTFSGTLAERYRMLCVSLALVLNVAFFLYYGQMITSMNVLAMNTMRGDLFGILPLKPEHNMMMNPFWCIIAGPTLSFLFGKLEARNIHIFTANKIAVAFALTSVAFAIVTWAVRSIGAELILSPELFLAVNFFQSFAEVLIGSLIVAFILEVAPERHSSFSVSMSMVAMSLSGMAAAIFSTYIALPEGQKLTQEFATQTYGSFFGTLTVLALVMSAVAFGFSFLMKNWIKKAETIEGKPVA